MKAPPLLVLLALASALALVAARAEPTAEMTADFAWFSKLGFPDVKELPFVRYCYGMGWFGDGKKEEQWGYGFLQEDTPPQFRILTIQFGSWQYSRDKHDFEANYRYEPADLRKFVEDELHLPDHPDDPFASVHRHLISGPHFSDRAHLFILAWMCARKGFDDLAIRLYAAAQTADGINRGAPRDENGWSFRNKLERDIGHFEMWRTIVAFGDPKTSRRELLARLRALPEHYPSCDHLARAASLAKQLEQMIAEDDAHPARTIAEIAGLSPADQAQEWIFRLRDQNGFQFAQPGWVDIFNTADGTKGTPAHRLVELSDAAVPGLIASLDDPRLTRSVGYGRDFVFSHEVVTVGDAAMKILERIAGREFYRSGRIQGTMVRDGATGPVRAAVQEWWEHRKAKGALGELAETVARGALGSAQAGAKLLKEFPSDAATPLLAGAAAAQSADERSAFIRLVGKLSDERALEFLLRETHDGPFLGPRADAAWQLLNLGRTDGLEPLAEVWRRTPPSSKPAEQGAREKLINVLALADSPAGIHALADGLRERSAEARSRVVSALGRGRDFLLSGLGDFRNPDGKLLRTSAPTSTAMEELLVSELEDTGDYAGHPVYIGVEITSKLRLCDAAAITLTARWPDRYKFEHNASYSVREQERIACLNVWRKEHSLPLAPSPPVRPHVAAGDETKIAEVAFADGGIAWPESVLAILGSAKGRKMDPSLFLEMEQAFLEECGGHAPAGDQGFAIEAFRENATDGVTLIVTPSRRPGLTEHPERTWRLDYSVQLGQSNEPRVTRFDLFGRHPIADDPHKLDEIFRKISALSPGTPFRFWMELASQRWDVDTQF